MKRDDPHLIPTPRRAVAAILIAGSVILPVMAISRYRAVPTGAASGARRLTSARLVSDASPADSVRLLPLFEQARRACVRKQFTRAAGLLTELHGAKGLTAEQRVYLAYQRDLCLKDAGLPVGPTQPVRPAAPRLPAPLADCGPRAMKIACDALGVPASVAMLSKAANTDPVKGTSFEGLAKAAAAVGLQADGCLLSRQAFREMTTPTIVCINKHFITVTALTGSGDETVAIARDPNRPNEERFDSERLLEQTGGYVLLLRR